MKACEEVPLEALPMFEMGQISDSESRQGDWLFESSRPTVIQHINWQTLQITEFRRPIWFYGTVRYMSRTVLCNISTCFEYIVLVCVPRDFGRL